LGSFLEDKENVPHFLKKEKLNIPIIHIHRNSHSPFYPSVSFQHRINIPNVTFHVHTFTLSHSLTRNPFPLTIFFMHFGTCAAAAPHRWLHLHQHHRNREWTRLRAMARGGGEGPRQDGDTSYLDMWKKAVERERKTTHFKTISERVASTRHHGAANDDLDKKTTEFHKLLQIPSEERDRVQRMQVIDRAAAAIAAARALIHERGNAGSGDEADPDEPQRGTTELPVSISFASFFLSFSL